MPGVCQASACLEERAHRSPLKLLVDAHLPRRLCQVFVEAGHDAQHTFDLPLGNATTDREINERSVRDLRIVVSKDTDFFHSHIVQGRPWKLLIVRTGNISTSEVCALFQRNLQLIETSFDDHSLVEIDRDIVTPVQ